MSFQERFKSKFSLVGKKGEMQIQSERAIVKASQSQMHSPIIKSIAKIILDQNNNVRPPSAVHYHNLSLPVRQIESQATSSSYIEPVFIGKPKTVGYKPYSLRDYELIKPKKYYVLGGVGPSYVGTED